jgi:hypothetical protein
MGNCSAQCCSKDEMVLNSYRAHQELKSTLLHLEPCNDPPVVSEINKPIVNKDIMDAEAVEALNNSSTKTKKNTDGKEETEQAPIMVEKKAYGNF